MWRWRLTPRLHTRAHKCMHACTLNSTQTVSFHNPARGARLCLNKTWKAGSLRWPFRFSGSINNANSGSLCWAAQRLKLPEMRIHPHCDFREYREGGPSCRQQAAFCLEFLVPRLTLAVGKKWLPQSKTKLLVYHFTPHKTVSDFKTQCRNFPAFRSKREEGEGVHADETEFVPNSKASIQGVGWGQGSAIAASNHSEIESLFTRIQRTIS